MRTDRPCPAVGLFVLITLVCMGFTSGSVSAWVRATGANNVNLPIVRNGDACQPIPGESYETLSIDSVPSDCPAEEHPDLNLALRGYAVTHAYKGLVDYAGASDSNAPQLAGLFSSKRLPIFRTLYRAYGWDWARDCRGALISYPDVTLAGLATTAGEILYVSASGYTLGSGYEVLVLYASHERITLKYTREDNVIGGYTLHIEGVCIEPSLLALYQSCDDAGRYNLPALQAGQGFGRARGNEVGIAIRDYGTFMDPRSRKDWWQER